MTISNKDLDFLIELEDFIYQCGIDHNKVSDMTVEQIEKAFAPYFHTLFKMNERLINEKRAKNIVNRQRIAEKRKTNKFYARSKKEIEIMKGE